MFIGSVGLVTLMATLSVTLLGAIDFFSASLTGLFVIVGLDRGR